MQPAPGAETARCPSPRSLIALGAANSEAAHWFLVRADDLIPQIVEGLPQEHPVWSHGEHDTLLPDWLGETTIDKTAMRSCKRHEWLLVKAWDQS